MSDTRMLLNRIAALRQRMEQAQPGGEQPAPAVDRVQRLENELAAGSRYGALLDGSFRQLPDTASALGGPVLPSQLTARARRLLIAGQGLLSQLRNLGNAFAPEVRGADSEPASAKHSWQIDARDPLAGRYREIVAMTDTALRTVQAYPESPSIQLRLCDGLEAILGVIAQRLAELHGAVQQRCREASQLNTLASLLLSIEAGKRVEMAALMSLAEALLADAEQTAPLRFHPAPPFIASAPEPMLTPATDRQNTPEEIAWLAQAIACHSLTVAQVLARVVRHDAELRGQPVEPVLAALVYDVGMLRLPVAVCTQAGPLDEGQRRVMETHPRIGAELIGRLLPSAGWLVEAAGSHHERMDGTGYPAGLRELQIAPLVRLLSVCDVFAAMCQPRPHRPAHEPRTALTDALLLAEQGALDRYQAERLLQLSFYPVGSAVELADGAVAVVVATHQARRDLNTPSRPVLALLTDAQGQFLAAPRHLDLAVCDGRSIVRSLPADERRKLLGKRYPDLA